MEFDDHGARLEKLRPRGLVEGLAGPARPRLLPPAHGLGRDVADGERGRVPDVTADPRGYHPDTIVPGRGYGGLEAAQDAITLLDALGEDDAVIVGHDRARATGAHPARPSSRGRGRARSSRWRSRT